MALDSSASIATSTTTFTSYSTGDYVIANRATVNTTPATISVSNSALSSTSPAVINTATPADVSYYVSPLTYTNKASATAYQDNILLTCSISGSTPMTYSLVSSGGQPVPSWMTLNSAQQRLEYTTPTEVVTTTYNFGIQTTISGVNSVATVYLSVDPPVPVTPVTPPVTPPASVPASTPVSTTTNDDAYKNAFRVSDEVYEAAFGSLTGCMGAVLVMCVASIIMAQGSIQALWSMINQFQFYILIPMVGAFIPYQLLEFLEGLDFTLFNFDFIPVSNKGTFGGFLEYFECDEEDDYLVSIGIESACALVNNVKIILMIALFILIHIFVFLLFKKYKDNDRN